MITYVPEEYVVDNNDIINNHVNFVFTTEEETVLFIRIMDTSNTIVYMRIFDNGEYDTVNVDKTVAFKELFSGIENYTIEDVRVSNINAEVKKGK